MEEEIKCEIEQFINQGETFSITSEEFTNFKNTRYFNISDKTKGQYFRVSL